MSKKKIKKIKVAPILPRPPKSNKIATEFAKKNPKKVKLKKDAIVHGHKNVIEPLVKQLDDGSYISSPSGEKHKDLFHLIANLK